MTAYVLDTETHALHGRVIELALYPIGVGSTNFREFHGKRMTVDRYNPMEPMEIEALAVHHITNDMVATKPPYTEARLPDDLTYAIGHYVKYDIDCLKLSGVNCHPAMICTKTLAMIAFPDMKSYRLVNLCYALSDDHNQIRQIAKNAHSAAADVELTYWLLLKIISQLAAMGYATDLEYLHALTVEANINYHSKPESIEISA